MASGGVYSVRNAALGESTARVQFFGMVVAYGGIVESVIVACLFNHAR